MIVSVIGGHGSIARLLTRQLVDRGHSVRGLVRDEAQFEDLRGDGARPVLCDLERVDETDLDAALATSDVVVFAAGAVPEVDRSARRPSTETGQSRRSTRLCVWGPTGS